MSPTPDSSAVTVETRTKPSDSLFLAVVATITLLAARWSGYAALPYVVIFAPVLAVAGILLLTLALIIIFLIVSTVAGAVSDR